MIKNVVEFSHLLMRSYVKEGYMVIDATCGNGGDTLLLCQLVGKNGKVYGFDIQSVAIENTKKLLEGKYQNATLINDCHSNIKNYIDEKIDFCIFNLGYLPKGDKSIVTKENTTITAIKNICQMLNKNGVLIICSYLSHEGGYQEYLKVKDYLTSLDKKQFDTGMFFNLNRSEDSPRFFVVERVGG